MKPPTHFPLISTTLSWLKFWDILSIKEEPQFSASCVFVSCVSPFFGIKKFYDSFTFSQKDNLLLEYPLLLPLKGFVTSNALDKVFKNNNMILKSNIYLYTTEMIIALAREGLGIGWALKNCVEKELEEGIFYQIPLDIEMPKIELGLAYNKKFINKTARVFVEFLL